MKNAGKITALILALGMIMSLAGCSDNDTGSSERETLDDQTVASGSEATEETEEAAETEETEAAEESESAGHEPTEDELAYDAYTAFAYDAASEYEGELLFGYDTDVHDDRIYWKLLISYPDSQMTEVYEYTDGAVNYVETLDYYSDLLPYSLFSELPCMVSIHETGLGDSITDPVDGRYFGSIDAVCVDGSYLLLKIGDPFIISEEDYNSLEVGDVLNIPPYYGSDEGGATVTEITENNGIRQVQLDNLDELYFSRGAYSEDDTDYILMTYSDNPVTFNDRLCLVPVSDDCEVTDVYSYLFSEEDQAAFAGWTPAPGANALTSSAYWFYETEVQNFVPDEVHGWVPASGLVYPVTIGNGEVTSVEIEWR